jgi:hypothetical protein
MVAIAGPGRLLIGGGLGLPFAGNAPLAVSGPMAAWLRWSSAALVLLLAQLRPP